VRQMIQIAQQPIDCFLAIERHNLRTRLIA
jgi:hypothetical protein